MRIKCFISVVGFQLLMLPALYASGDFQGVWNGAILSKSGTENYNLAVQITRDEDGDYVGATQYLDLGCSGELTLFKESSDALLFKELLTDGQDKCVKNATIKLAKTNAGGLVYEWYFPNGKIGLQAPLVGDEASSESVSPSLVAGNNSGDGDDASEEQMAALAFRAIDQMAAHPDDSQNSAGVEGLTDDELAEVSLEEIAELIEVALPYAEQNMSEPRYLFALGRAALIHGDEEFAHELLTKAAKHGSAAAQAYLAHLTDDINEVTAHLRNAVNGGFAPARDWLAEAEAALAQENTHSEPELQFDPGFFNRPDLMGAFHSGETAALQQSILENLTYISTIHNFLSDTSSVLFIAENRMIITEVDPAFSHQIAKKLAGSKQGTSDAINMGMQSIWAPLKAMANARSQGGSIQEEVMAMQGAIVSSPQAMLEIVRKQASQDAARLAILYDSDPSAFRKIYAGMKKFVGEI